MPEEIKKPELQISVNSDPAPDGGPLLAVVMVDALIFEEDGELLTGMTMTPELARKIAQIFLDVADEAEMIIQ
jgi:hypothetical protein